MKIWKRIRNIFKQQIDNADAALADTTRDGKYAIEDAKKEVQQFTTKIAELKRQTIVMQRRLKEAESNISKMQKVAEIAVESGNDMDAAAALTQKKSWEKQASEYGNQIKQNDALYQQFIRDREDRMEKIRKAETNISTLAARKDAASMRESAAKVRAGFKGSDALSVLDELEEEVLKAESEAEAFEHIAAVDTSVLGLEEKYANINSVVEDELAALKAAKAAKETAK